eukprot:GILI01011458.1.p1 GENE.GILI01011458.1~~GILI01011458.1.p1  ORF type:complete len:365 (-),score=121.38 GILI01011458.1:430-1488(-)
MQEQKLDVTVVASVSRLVKQRERELQDIQEKKRAIEEATKRRSVLNSQKFGVSSSDVYDEQFKQQTVGLVSIEEFRQKRAHIDQIIEAEAKKKQEEEAAERERKRKERDSKGPKLSFTFGDEEEEGEEEKSPEPLPKKKKLGKDPTVDTDFLPDPEREEQERVERARLIEEYMQEQERVKNEMLEVTYSYWDGSGHRRNIRVKKGTSISQFLESCRRQLEKEFPELKSTTADNLMYIKEDIILPHTSSFYDLIKNKARGKSGPLFHFDVHDDVRMFHDATVEKDESHAGKIVERKWYERNKHIFPASRWEIYDPTKTFDKYTVHGGEVNGGKKKKKKHQKEEEVEFDPLRRV